MEARPIPVLHTNPVIFCRCLTAGSGTCFFCAVMQLIDWCDHTFITKLAVDTSESITPTIDNNLFATSCQVNTSVVRELGICKQKC